MAHPVSSDESEALTRAFTGFGVDEESMISILTKWDRGQRMSFRKSCPAVFRNDHRQFERWDDDHMRQFKIEVQRFKRAVVFWAMHPWERDARLARKVTKKGYRFSILIEISCARSSEELFGARKAYHSLYHHSLEEDVAFHFKDKDYCNLLVALVSSYRYEGTEVNEEIAKSEAKILGKSIKSPGTKKPVEDYEVIKILSTRSKSQLQATFNHYKKIHGGSIDEDVKDDLSLQATIQCLCSPPTHFSKMLEIALKDGEDDDRIKEALTQVIITRADVDMNEIKEEFLKQNKVDLQNKVETTTHGKYKDFLLALVGKVDR